VGVADQYQINDGEIANAQSRPAQPLQDKQPASEDGIDQQVHAADLRKKTGVPDEGERHLPFARKGGATGAAGPPGEHRVSHQSRELSRFPAESLTEHI